jgi:hypothetical protein
MQGVETPYDSKEHRLQVNQELIRQAFRAKYSRPLRLLTPYVAIPQFTGCWGKKSDLERFAQALSHQCSLLGASAYSSGQMLLTLQGIY